jgi:hypothetical protein
MRILSLEQPQRGIGACLGQILARFMMLAFWAILERYEVYTPPFCFFIEIFFAPFGQWL